MRFYTYSQVWGLRRIFYHIHKMRLPFPVNISELIIFTVTECFSYVLWKRGIHIGFAPQFLIFPFAVTWAMSRMELEGRAPHLFFASLIRYLIRPKLWARGRPVRAQKVQSLELTRVILKSHDERGNKQTELSEISSVEVTHSQTVRAEPNTLIEGGYPVASNANAN